MPAKTEKQRKFFGAVLGRARRGESLPSDPKMSESDMADFARKKKKAKRSGQMEALKG